jgi:hypothetical protein
MSERQFLGANQKDKLAQILDKKFDLPLVRGRREHRVWTKLVSAIDGFIAARVQDEFLDAMNDPDFQLEEEFANALKENLSPVLSTFLMVPILPQALKEKIINLILEIIVKALAGATTIDEVIEEFLAA